MISSRLKALTIALLAATAATAAVAGDPLPVRTIAVKYGDLDLQTADGKQELDRRLTSAARRVCPDLYSRRNQTSSAARACISRAVDEARGQVSQQQLANAPAMNRDRS